MSDKKKQKLTQATTNNLRHSTEPFQDYNADVFAAMAEAEVQDSTLPIMGIIPDVTQGRRIIPHEIRRDWNGTPQGYGALIDAWENRAHKGIKWSFPVDILLGKAPVLELKTDDPLVLDFAELLTFAANIRDIGLNHPIGVVKRGDYHRIVFGERRWTAFQILNHYLGDDEDWRNILARVIVATDWELAKAQAAENNQSKRFNAIGRAREFAKLLMIARSDGGDRYDSWNQLVVPGGCDRMWYAQVANGEIHRIPRNLGPQFEQALNISEITMRKYRSLLRLFDDHNLSNKVNDAIWMLGDAGSWSEGFMSDIRQYLSVEEVDEILNLTGGYTVPIGTVYATESALFKAVKAKKEAEEESKKAAELAQKQTEEAVALAVLQANAEGASNVPDTAADSDSHTPDQSAWASTAWVGKLAWAASLPVRVDRAVTPDTVIIVTADNEEIDVNFRSLRERTEQPSSTGHSIDSPAANWTSRAVQTVAGAVALVITDGNGYVQLRYPDDTTAQMEKKFVSLVPMTEWFQAVARYNAAKKAGNPTTGTTTTGAATPSTPAGTPGRNLTTAQLVGKPVTWNGKPAFVKATGDSIDTVLIKIGRDERIVHKDTVVLSPTAPEQTLKDYIEQVEGSEDDLLEETDNDFSPEAEVLDFEPFDPANMEILNALSEIADILDIEEAEIIADLCNLDRTRLERVLGIDGIAEVHKWEDIYRQAANTVLFAVMQRIELHLHSITELARKITEAK